MADKKMSEEAEILGHLLEVEQNAQTLTLNAQTEADKKISAAKSSADEKFKESFEKIVADNERIYEDSVEQIKAKADKEMQDFKGKILSSAKTTEKFDSCLDKILFA